MSDDQTATTSADMATSTTSMPAPTTGPGPRSIAPRPQPRAGSLGVGDVYVRAKTLRDNLRGLKMNYNMRLDKAERAMIPKLSRRNHADAKAKEAKDIDAQATWRYIRAHAECEIVKGIKHINQLVKRAEVADRNCKESLRIAEFLELRFATNLVDRMAIRARYRSERQLDRLVDEKRGMHKQVNQALLEVTIRTIRDRKRLGSDWL